MFSGIKRRRSSSGKGGRVRTAKRKTESGEIESGDSERKTERESWG